MAVSLLLNDPSLVIIDNSSNFSSNITSMGLKDDYSSSSNHLNFNMRRFDGADSSKSCLFAQYYNTSYGQWVSATYQNLGGQSFIDNLTSWSGITLPAGSNNTFLCLPYPSSAGGSLDLTQAYWTSMANNSPSYHYVSPYVSIVSSDSGSGGVDSTSDYSQITNAIILIPATIILVFFFKMIFNIFMNRKVRG